MVGRRERRIHQIPHRPPWQPLEVVVQPTRQLLNEAEAIQPIVVGTAGRLGDAGRAPNADGETRTGDGRQVPELPQP